MSAERRAELWPVMMKMGGEELELIVERGHIEADHTFSEEAMEQLFDQVIIYVGTRVKRRWDTTGEPPTRLSVEVRVTAS